MFRFLLLICLTFLINIAQIISIAIHLWRKEISKKAILQRFGFNLSNAQYDIWLHCASLGEAKVLVCLAKSMIKLNPNLNFLISVQRNIAEKYIKENLQANFEVIYFPLDALWVWKRFFKKIKVKKIICIESEIWPRLFEKKNKFDLKIGVVNARISSSSFNFFNNTLFIFKPVFASISFLCTQNNLMSKRFSLLGVSADRIHTAGNIKYDLLESEINHQKLDLDSSKYKQNLLFVSTRKNEEQIIQTIYADLLNQYPNLRIFIAPRHQSRFAEVYELFKKNAVQVGCFSKSEFNYPVCLIDSYGVLNQVYRIIDLVIVGGTLKNFGGHSIIEPASFSKPILIGPFTDHINEDVKLFKKNKAIVQIKNNSAKTLKNKIISLLNNPNQLEVMAKNAHQLIQSQKGASEKIAQLILKNDY